MTIAETKNGEITVMDMARQYSFLSTYRAMPNIITDSTRIQSGLNFLSLHCIFFLIDSIKISSFGDAAGLFLAVQDLYGIPLYPLKVFEIKAAFSVCKIRNNMAVSEDAVFICNKTFKAYRASRVDLAC